MQILLTGASGFLGSEINKHLKSRQFKVITLGRSNDSDIICDLSKESPLLPNNIDAVIHVAGKAHIVPKNENEVLDFYNVNTKGTENLLMSLAKHPPKSLIFISTVAVYGVESGDMIDENYALNGDTPYAKSKIIAEQKVLEFGKKQNINTTILRPPLITGINPIGNLGDILKAIRKGYYFRIGKGAARRSMVACSDIANLIPHLFDKSGVYNLTDKRHPTFKEIDSYIATLYGIKIKVLPRYFVKFLAKIGDVVSIFPMNSNRFNKMTNSLTFSDDKAVKELNWKPNNALKALEV